MSEPINLTFSYSEKEYVSGSRLLYARIYHTNFYFALSFIALSGATTGFLLFGASFLWYAAILVGLVSLVFALISFNSPKQHYRTGPLLREQLNFEFSEDGIWFRAKNIDSRFEWSLYKQVLETREFYYLLYGKNEATMIPKRVFTDAEEAVFRNLLQRKVTPKFEVFGGASKQTNELQSEYVPNQPLDWR
ncbi:MAG TPA: YcxB family protein [Pyrinomonadaceae bacterium]|jgi:hypothetical protein